MLFCALFVFPSQHVLAYSPAPDFTLTDIDGNTFTLKDFLGEVVIVDFFATWCQPCLEEIPALRDVKDRFPQGIAIISISVDPVTDTVANLQTFRNNYNATWIVTRDTAGVYEVYNVTAIPTIYIIDNAGYITFRHVGMTETSVLMSQLTPLVPEYPIQIILLVLVLAATPIAFAKKRARRTRLTRA